MRLRARRSSLSTELAPSHPCRPLELVQGLVLWGGGGVGNLPPGGPCMLCTRAMACRVSPSLRCPDRSHHVLRPNQPMH